ncbi:aldolase/citrate lyase family protein [Roseibium litorale]|uniref:HpcH/HpaI aldolase/citrate lyase family protein n=1 Tax=Roseibium litorale TaxID=2803841 RepID=A0ABR9CN55_9HYPH|nr:HpcH/HpaI aldolase/citrate lyase family protein [Roseibium litorale]MBD8892275.1 HpcH/HpaI aldolase/citrate lyase family protein [Roseibium litorale]
MPAPRNELKHRLAAGEVLHGCWISMADAYVTEMAATAGFDWLLIDGEHAPNDIRSLSSQLTAVLASPSQPIMRLVDDNPATIKQALDIGAQSLLIPMIESKEQAERTLRATRYPPHGFRGVGAAIARASKFNEIPDYLTTADAEICLILQVETRAGLAALDDILAIEGIDGVFIGPSDLAADMGHLGNPAAPEVLDAVTGALRRIRAAGKTAGVLSTDPAYISACKEAGANFVGVAIDVLAFAGALRSSAAHYKNGG